MDGHVLQTLREQLKVPGSRLDGSKLLTSEFLRFRSRLNYVRLVSNNRQRQSNIRQKLNLRFRRLIFQESNTMHKLCLFRLSRQTSFSALLWQVKRYVTVYYVVHHVLGGLRLALTVLRGSLRPPPPPPKNPRWLYRHLWGAPKISI